MDVNRFVKFIRKKERKKKVREKQTIQKVGKHFQVQKQRWLQDDSITETHQEIINNRLP